MAKRRPAGAEAAAGGDTAAAGAAVAAACRSSIGISCTPRRSRDPRGYIIPSDQPDFPTATKFVNALIKGGIVVDRATTDFNVAGKKYPAGSYVILAAQAFRPHLRDMLEPQDHPNDFEYPGGPPQAAV